MRRNKLKDSHLFGNFNNNNNIEEQAHPSSTPSTQLSVLQMFARSPNITQSLRSTGRWQRIFKKPTVMEVTEN